MVTVEIVRVGRQDLEAAVRDLAAVEVGWGRRDADGGVGRVAVTGRRGRGGLWRRWRGRRDRRRGRRGHDGQGRWRFGAADGHGGEDAGDEVAAAAVGLVLEVVEYAGHGRVGRVVDGVGPAAGHQLAVDEGVADVDVAEEAVVTIGLADVSDHADGLAGDEGGVGGGGLAAAGLAGFGGVDADVAHAVGLAVEGDDDCVAIDDAGDRGNLAGKGGSRGKGGGRCGGGGGWRGGWARGVGWAGRGGGSSRGPWGVGRPWSAGGCCRGCLGRQRGGPVGGGGGRTDGKVGLCRLLLLGGGVRRTRRGLIVFDG